MNMNFTKKIDRAFQWAGERMGGEAKTGHSDEFKMLETEMALRHEGMDRMLKAMNVYVKSVSRRTESAEDKEKNLPIGFLGRTLSTHGEDFASDSEYGACLLSMGQANERIAGIQETFVDCATATWLENLERSQAMMKDYQNARKKLESRRLAYDASTTKLAKARRDDFRVEEEVRMNKGKFEETSEDVLRRMQDIKEAEVESIAALTSFLDAELEYHERCAEELRRVRQNWAGAAAATSSHSPSYGGGGVAAAAAAAANSKSISSTIRSRSNTARSYHEPRQTSVYEEKGMEPEPQRIISTRATGGRLAPPPPPQPPRPSISRSLTSDGRMTPLANARPPPVPQLTRYATDGSYISGRDDVFADDVSSMNSRSGSPEYGDRSASPATSYGSLSRSTTSLTGKKPPPPPVNRAKKPPPPPVPARRENLGC